MRKIDEMLDALRANPVRFVAWTLVLLVLFAVGVTLGDGLGIQLYLFIH